jgi:hypothetical protein
VEAVMAYNVVNSGMMADMENEGDAVLATVTARFSR